MNPLLQANLDALKRTDADLAAHLQSVQAHPSVRFEQARQEQALTAHLGLTGQARSIALASAYNPLEQARRFALAADTQRHGTLLVLGVGLGYHVSALAERAAGHALVVAYEPDEQLFRAVLEKVDCTAWLGRPDVVLFVGPPDGAAVTARLEKHVALISQGVQILTHPPARRLHDQALRQFSSHFTQFVAFCRTNLATTLVNAATTCRNLAENLALYAAGPTLDELAGAADGYPAVLVAAGPSLARNVAVLADPDVRANVLVIAVQTALKPLLARGIRPDFVTALDYHEISRRFYEGLDDLDDVTLVAEPKANKAILDAYPGPIRLLKNRFLDLLLGPLARPRDGLPAGTTVAHLSFYLAQYLGCDPIIFIGQDLGFSDGLYYCPGTAIHDLWAAQLNPFNSLEMMEWKRIARHKAHLHKTRDVHGRPIYTDEQMLTYLRQFERDFAQAPQTLIDATEGGMPKQHTTTMTLQQALDRFAGRPVPPLPLPDRQLDRQRLLAVADLLDQRRRQVDCLARASRRTLPILQRMLRFQRDPARMARLFKQLEKQQQCVAEHQQAFALVNELNQVGALNRLKADRALRADEPADPYEKQRRQLERDIENVQWLAQACRETLDIFDAAADRLASHLPAECAS